MPVYRIAAGEISLKNAEYVRMLEKDALNGKIEKAPLRRGEIGPFLSTRIKAIHHLVEPFRQSPECRFNGRNLVRHRTLIPAPLSGWLAAQFFNLRVYLKLCATGSSSP